MQSREVVHKDVLLRRYWEVSRIWNQPKESGDSLPRVKMSVEEALRNLNTVITFSRGQRVLCRRARRLMQDIVHFQCDKCGDKCEVVKLDGTPLETIE